MEDQENKIEQPQREKYWEELTADEKTERMRMVVRGLQQQVNGLKNRNYQLTDALRAHSHTEKDVVVPIRMMSEGGCPTDNVCCGNEEKPWF